ncbi:receptor-like protein EIX2 [Lycium ferocissimum]|uniref:receptor-like protein EIX2 n=1 Tax=Lycium ferocissimum TaxID=112874 RepID=UPI002814C4B6|nr:receptor-like protein EIX2 [Lycium ferocissimum]
MSGTILDFSRKMSALLLLDLSANSFSGPVPQLPTEVTTLDLSRNKLSRNISFTYDNFDSLGYLDLSDNLFAKELPHCWKLSSLVRLNLANNNFSGEIPSSIGLSKDMQMLQLRNNHFIGELPQSLEKCKYLRFIDVGENNLSGEIPAWIGNTLAYISVVILRSNRFSGSIPSSICQLTRIQILDISQNKISGTLPKCINNLTTLTEEESPK